MNQSEDRTPEEPHPGFTEEVIEKEKLWRLINFMSCVHMTKFVRKLVWNHEMRVSEQHDCQILSKLLKCITFVQDMNQCTKISEVLGDKLKYVVSENLGEPILTGSTEEGLALFGLEIVDSRTDYDRLNYAFLHDLDIMYESHKMMAYEIHSMFLTPFDESGVLRVFIRPGTRAGYVTLQKLLPVSIVLETKDTLLQFANVYPKPEEYYDQEHFALVYISVLAFLIASMSDFSPQECSCYSANLGGLNPNRYGDLCSACQSLTLREIPRGEGISPTKIWADHIRIKGPSIEENGIIENTSEHSGAAVPIDEAEYPGINVKRRLADERDTHASQTVRHDLGDIFSSPDRTKFYFDHVPAVKCSTWPSAAWEFTVRERPSGWPPWNVIKDIVSKGCHIVPKSTKPTPETRLKLAFHCVGNTKDYKNWRLSFSLAEKTLVSTLNAVQVKCYMLLKILNIIATRVFFRELERKGIGSDESSGLSSYLLKTTFFWVCEEIPLEEWSDDNLASCFFKVVEKLIMFLEKATIPNYFIPSSNLIVPNIINPEMTRVEAFELASCFERFRAITSQDIFAILHTAVWNELWKDSEIVPPGCTPQELAIIVNALKEQQRETWYDPRSKSKDQASKHDVSEDLTASSTDESEYFTASSSEDDDVESLGDSSMHRISDSNVTVSSTSSLSTSTVSRCGKPMTTNTETMDGQCFKRVVASDAIQKMPKIEKILAQIFTAISKFLYTNGNIRGKGFNTARAAFYEDEARKLLPEGCSLEDLPRGTFK